MTSRIQIVETPEALARAAAEEMCARAERSAREKGVFFVALAGGSTPRSLYRLLAGEGDSRFRDRFPWARAHFFLGDERHVPPTDDQSNYKMAYDTLLSKVPVPPGHVVRVWSESPDPAPAADYYESLIRKEFHLENGGVPRFDLILLGLGADAHTASLFPGSEALKETRRLVAAPRIEKVGAHRFTLTPPVLNNASCVLFMVAGEEKAEALRSVLEGPRDPDRYPAQIVQPAAGEVIWLVDRAASRLLARAA